MANDILGQLHYILVEPNAYDLGRIRFDGRIQGKNIAGQRHRAMQARSANDKFYLNIPATSPHPPTMPVSSW